MKLFKIISLPVPTASNMSSKHATQLMSLPDYFAVSDQKNYYAQLKTKDLENCKKKKKKKEIISLSKKTGLCLPLEMPLVFCHYIKMTIKVYINCAILNLDHMC